MRKHALFISIAALVSAAQGASTMFFDDFASYATTKASFGDSVASYTLGKDGNRTVARMTMSNDTSGGVYMDCLLPDSLKGAVVMFSVSSRGIGLSEKGLSGFGIKAMLTTVHATGATDNVQLLWPDANGPYAWTRSSQMVALPSDAKELHLTLGMEYMKGTVYFDSVKIERIGSVKLPEARPSTLAIPKSFGTFVRRGAMVGVPPDSSSIVLFGSVWKGNLFRWQMNGPDISDSAVYRPNFFTVLQNEIDMLDKAAPILRKNGLQVIVDLHFLSRGLFENTKAQSNIIKAWQILSTHYAGNPIVAGYDLANEPDETFWKPGTMLWNDLVDTLCRTIRAIDPNTPIVVSTVLGDAARFPVLQPVGANRGWDLKNIVYSFHFYYPAEITMQGENDVPIGEYSYPGFVGEVKFDSLELVRGMQLAIDYQKKYRVPMYVGEFNCIRWAPKPSAYNWMKHVTGILETLGWDWTYHAFREYQGWSLELNDDPNSSTEMVTDREGLIRGLFAKNQNPYTAIQPGNRSVQLDPVKSVHWGRRGDGSLSVTGIPEGSKLEVIDANGVVHQIPRAESSVSLGRGVRWQRLTGSSVTRWEPVPLVP